jgi:hypothetical protein
LVDPLIDYLLDESVALLVPEAAPAGLEELASAAEPPEELVLGSPSSAGFGRMKPLNTPVPWNESIFPTPYRTRSIVDFMDQ